MVGAAGLAGLALTRVAYGWVLTVAVIALLAWWLVRRSPSARRSVAVVGLALVLCVPWLAYTHSKTDRLFVWGNSGSLSLYWMTSPHDGDLGDWHQAHRRLHRSRPPAPPEFFESLRGLGLAEQNAEIEREALRNIGDHPRRVRGERRRERLADALQLPLQPHAAETQRRLLRGAERDRGRRGRVFCAFVLLPRRRALPPESGAFALLAGTAFALHVLVSAYPSMLAPIVAARRLVHRPLARRERPAQAGRSTRYTRADRSW